MSGLLSGQKLSCSYAAALALSEVNLSLSAGKILAVVGPNGSGKSTLLAALLGLVESSGSVEWEGKGLSQWSRRDLSRRVAYLPQSPQWLAEQTVADALSVGRAPYWGPLGLESTGDQRVILSVARTLELTDLLDRRMDELSGGQRQTVLLGRCLIQEPKAMLLDEPDTFLDLKHQFELRKLLAELARERGIGVLMATHDLNFAGAFADEVIVLNQGRVAAAGSPEMALTPEILERVYGLPMERIERAGAKSILVPRF
jgi:iron complex transport system ATP-binding protein